MSVIPQKNERLDLYEGSTFDETWEFQEDDGSEMDLTGWSAELKVRMDPTSAVILAITSGVLTPGPSASAIELGGTAGTARIYVGSTVMAALDAGSFLSVPQEDGSVVYQGVWDLELVNPDGERFRYVMGPVIFSPEVTY